MFADGFVKTAVSYANLAPEDIAERVSEKYPYQGAVYGGLLGAAAGAAKKKSYKGAVVGAGIGGAAGAGVGHSRKEWSKYKARRLRREVHEYNLRATPHRQRYHVEE